MLASSCLRQACRVASLGGELHSVGSLSRALRPKGISEADHVDVVGGRSSSSPGGSLRHSKSSSTRKRAGLRKFQRFSTSARYRMRWGSVRNRDCILYPGVGTRLF